MNSLYFKESIIPGMFLSKLVPNIGM